MPRAIWNGSINFGLVTIPVKMYPAFHDQALHFNYLHKADGGRIRYERVCAVCGKKVGWNDLVRGYEYAKGEHVLVEDKDLARLRPEATQAVDIFEFVDASQIELMFFDTPYYLAPDKKGRRAYQLLREALRESKRVGIARVVIRTREHLAALKPVDQVLVVETMHWPNEVADPRSVEVPAEEKTSAAEMRMAQQLIDAMTSKFDPRELKDRYRDELMALIEARVAGRSIPVPKGKARAATNVVDLVKVLEKSIAQTKAHPARTGGKSPRGGRGGRHAA